jgi:hypothetical protein
MKVHGALVDPLTLTLTLTLNLTLTPTLTTDMKVHGALVDPTVHSIVALDGRQHVLEGVEHEEEGVDLGALKVRLMVCEAVVKLLLVIAVNVCESCVHGHMLTLSGDGV